MGRDAPDPLRRRAFQSKGFWKAAHSTIARSMSSSTVTCESGRAKLPAAFSPARIPYGSEPKRNATLARGSSGDLDLEAFG